MRLRKLSAASLVACLVIQKMSLAFFYSPLAVACGGKANVLCVSSQHDTF